MTISDVSKICQSKIKISSFDYSYLEEEIKKVKYPTNPISIAQKIEDKIKSFPSQKVQ